MRYTAAFIAAVLAFFGSSFSVNAVNSGGGNTASMLYPQLGRSGSYAGTLNLISVKDYHTTTGCGIPGNRLVSFTYRTNSRGISVYTGVTGYGTIEMTGRYQRKSWKSILDKEDYTFRLHAKRVTKRKAYVTHAITAWVTGSTYCKWTWKGWVRRS